MRIKKIFIFLLVTLLIGIGLTTLMFGAAIFILATDPNYKPSAAGIAIIIFCFLCQIALFIEGTAVLIRAIKE